MYERRVCFQKIIFIPFEPQLFICESNITLETDILSFVNETMYDGLHCGQ